MLIKEMYLSVVKLTH